jgi:hypothetical protein
VTNFNDMAIEGVNYFQSLFKVDNQATIVEVIRLSNSFPSFHNPSFDEEVGKEELHMILQRKG